MIAIHDILCGDRLAIRCQCRICIILHSITFFIFFIISVFVIIWIIIPHQSIDILLALFHIALFVKHNISFNRHFYRAVIIICIYIVVQPGFIIYQLYISGRYFYLSSICICIITAGYRQHIADIASFAHIRIPV